ncbi:MAG: YggS family pyridoxal phosphate-dependent enzyme [Bacteroidales bacterium]|nr:YggS family pyridoxal phosphate-dependent enzyme [Bacteroidales bacterium]
MEQVAENLKKFLQDISAEIKLIAVSKRQPEEKLQAAYDAGHRIFGENLVQELVRKKDLFPTDIEWHMIGHLQKNKVKYLVPFIHCIHSVDGLDLLKEINKRAEKINRPISCLFEIHIAKEESKSGIRPDDLKQLLEENPLSQFPFVKVKGLMGMATNTNDTELIRKEFHTLRQLHDELKQTLFAGNPEFKELSMGMSGDYKIAINEGSTMIRIGTAIFGERVVK